jgi:NADH-quinone oxidoreductase subunit L
VPLIVLAALSIATGYLPIADFLAPGLPSPDGTSDHGHGPAAYGIMAVATFIGLAGIAAAYYAYVQSPGWPERMAQQWARVYRLSLNKWYFDEAYDRTLVRPTVSLADALWQWVDVAVIDAAVNGVGTVIAKTGRLMRVLQTGQTQHYALGMALGAVVILTVYLFF